MQSSFALALPMFTITEPTSYRDILGVVFVYIAKSSAPNTVFCVILCVHLAEMSPYFTVNEQKRSEKG